MPIKPTQEEIDKGKKMPNGRDVLEAIINSNPSMAQELAELDLVDVYDDDDDMEEDD